MRFKIVFDYTNIRKFSDYIKQCKKIFDKTGILMTFFNDEYIQVVADPFNISDILDKLNYENEVIRIYGSQSVLEYNLEKEKSYKSLEIKTRKNENSQINEYGDIITFRIANDQLKKLNKILHDFFINSEILEIEATKDIPKKIKDEVGDIYSNTYLSINDGKSQNGILFKPQKHPMIKYIDNLNNTNIKNEEEENIFVENYSIEPKKLKKFLNLFCSKILDCYYYIEKNTYLNFYQSGLIILNAGQIFEMQNPLYLDKDKTIYDNSIIKFSIERQSLLRMFQKIEGCTEEYDRIKISDKYFTFYTKYYSFDEDEEDVDREKIKQQSPTFTLKIYVNCGKTEIIEYNENNKRDYILKYIDNKDSGGNEDLNKLYDEYNDDKFDDEMDKDDKKKTQSIKDDNDENDD